MGTMRRGVGLAAVWLMVAVAAVTVAWQGVNVVGRQVTDRRPAALSAGEIEDRLSARTAGDGAGASAGASTEPPSTTASSTAPPATAASAAETRTYNLVGGTVSLRFAATGVTVVFANPGPGFTVDSEPENVNGVKVEFESETHRSRVDGWWDNGPLDRVREEPDED